MIEPKPAPIASVQTASAPKASVDAPQIPVASKPRRKAAAQDQLNTSPSTLPSTLPSALPLKPPAAPQQTTSQAPVDNKIEENQPKVAADTAVSATETVAMIPSDAQVDPIATSLGAPTDPKLAYPGSAKLQLDGKFARKGNVQTGSGLLSWRTDGSSYALSLEATAMVILSQAETSVGTLSAQGLQPQTYNSKRTGRSEQATHFRAALGKIQFSNNKPDAVLLAGAQDRLSVLIALAGIVGGDPERYAKVNRIQMQVATLDNAEVWEFNIEGAVELAVPAGTLQALKLSRTPRNEFDQRLEIWLSPQLGYLPIRIRQSSVTAPSEDYVDLVLQKLP